MGMPADFFSYKIIAKGTLDRQTRVCCGDDNKALLFRWARNAMLKTTKKPEWSVILCTILTSGSTGGQFLCKVGCKGPVRRRPRGKPDPHVDRRHGFCRCASGTGGHARTMRPSDVRLQYAHAGLPACAVRLVPAAARLAHCLRSRWCAGSAW